MRADKECKTQHPKVRFLTYLNRGAAAHPFIKLNVCMQTAAMLLELLDYPLIRQVHTIIP
jgi:hypothetical protein